MGIRMLHLRRAASPFPSVPAFSARASTARSLAGPATVVRHTTVDLGRRIGRRAPSLVRVRSLLRAPALVRARSLVRAPSVVRLRESAAAWRLWADLARGWLALLLALLPRPRPSYTVTVFTAALPAALSEPPNGSAPRRPRPHRRAPEPGATP
ncbi:hypothetical protein ACWC10_23965 [Streptomyces sp. NPDC001595]|uniref:hypothetical protein n=1 Tax=Streptomyces sp. NPDC001532 TaxID=3154520 RepID=UPI00332C8AE3